MSAPAGWYPNPADQRVSRYWDGSAWTAQRVWNGAVWVESPAPQPGWSPAVSERIGAPLPPALVTDSPATPPPAPGPKRGSLAAKRWWVLAAAVIAVAVIVPVAVVGTSSGSGGASGSRVSYCHAFAKDWPILASASQKASDAYPNMLTPLADQSMVSQQLRADHATYESAASAASTLARSAPTKLKNDITTDTENAKQRLLDLSAALTSIAKGDTKQLGAVDVTAFDSGDTGCNFAILGGPDGTVAAEFWP